MPLFTYQALDQRGRIRTGELQAADKAVAFSMLERERLTALSLESEGGASAVARPRGLTFFSSLSAIDKILLTKHLAAVIRAGLSLNEALEILWEDAQKPLLKKLLFEAKSRLERGQTLSSTFELYPKYFPPVFVGLVRAGERSGTLEEALNNLGQQLLRDNDLIKKVRGALVYPAILLAGSFGVVILLLTFLLPRLLKVFATTKVKLPITTRFLVSASNLLSAQPLVTVGVFLGLLAGVIFIIRSPRGRGWVVMLLSRLPMARSIIKKLALARLTRTFGNLLKSGIGALEALEITASTIGNATYQAALLSARETVRRGGSLAGFFRTREDLFPRLLVSMIMVGEHTGALEKFLDTLSAFYDEEVDNDLKNLVGALEPILLVIMGLVVGGIALSVLLPIYQLVSSFR